MHISEKPALTAAPEEEPPPWSPTTSPLIPPSAATPAALIKRRYFDADVELLQQAAWWDWPIEVISAHAATLMAGTPADIAGIADQYVHRHLR